MVQNKRLIFKQIPVGFPVPGKDLVLETEDFDLEQPPPPGGLTIKILYVSFDPYLRGRMRSPELKSYSPPFILGKPITSNTVFKVIKSDSTGFAPGDLVHGNVGLEEYSIVLKEVVTRVRKLENPYNLDPIEFTGAMGMPGLTAYSSLYDIGKPVKGETIFISSASGAVGQIVGQLAKHEGLKVIGSVGSDEKLNFIIKELKFDGGFNYKKEDPFEALKRLAPNGIDIYYENVGGIQLEAALEALNDFGRIVACGMISDYNKSGSERYGVKNLMQIVAKRLTMRGFIVSDPNMGPLYQKERDERVGKWLSDGTFISKISITEGMDNAAEGLVGLFKGENFGKAVLRVADH